MTVETEIAIEVLLGFVVGFVNGFVVGKITYFSRVRRVDRLVKSLVEQKFKTSTDERINGHDK